MSNSPMISGNVKVYREALYLQQWSMEFFKEDLEGLPEEEATTPWTSDTLQEAVSQLFEYLTYEAVATVKDVPPVEPVVLTVRIELLVDGLPMVAETNFASNRVNEHNVLEQVEYLHSLLDYQIAQPLSSILINMEA